MKKIKFDCHRSSAPAYSCDTPGDNSGFYYRTIDVDLFIDDIYNILRFEKNVHVSIKEVLDKFMGEK